MLRPAASDPRRWVFAGVGVRIRAQSRVVDPQEARGSQNLETAQPNFVRGRRGNERCETGEDMTSRAILQ